MSSRSKDWAFGIGSIGAALGIALGACSSGDSATTGGNDGGAGDGSTSTSSDAGLGDGSALDGSSGTTKGCPGTGDPSACDDGTGSLGTKAACPLGNADPTATSSYHVQVAGSGFADIGACVYVTESGCSTTAGDLLQFSGGYGTDVQDSLNDALTVSPYCFRALDVKWDTAWEDDGKTTGGPVGHGGDVLAASGRVHAIIQWLHDFERTSASTPFCGRASSGGTSAVLYEIFHGSGDALFDHVQLQHATPFMRFDIGCDPASPPEGTNVVCSGLPASTMPQYAGGHLAEAQTMTHDPNCDADGGTLGDSERAALHAMSVITPDVTKKTLNHTSVSAFMCSMAPTATQGQAVFVFGVDADLASAGSATYNGILDVKLDGAFNGCAAGAECPPHVDCSNLCSGESFGSHPPDRQAMLDDMQANCVLRH